MVFFGMVTVDVERHRELCGVVGEDWRRLRQSPKHIDLREEHSHKEKLEECRGSEKQRSTYSRYANTRKEKLHEEGSDQSPQRLEA
jgi:hypothetical protein